MSVIEIGLAFSKIQTMIRVPLWIVISWLLRHQAMMHPAECLAQCLGLDRAGIDLAEVSVVQAIAFSPLVS
jgi:hypothetical protein